jgi:hypothetical protein
MDVSISFVKEDGWRGTALYADLPETTFELVEIALDVCDQIANLCAGDGSELVDALPDTLDPFARIKTVDGDPRETSAGLVQQLDDRGSRDIQRQAVARQDRRGRATLLAQQAKEQVFSPDITVTQSVSFFSRVLKHPFGFRAERDLD